MHQGQIVAVNVGRPGGPAVIRPGVVLDHVGDLATVQVWVCPADDDLVRQLGGEWGPSWWVGYSLEQGTGSGQWQILTDGGGQ
jgi:hypothetical protein